MILQLISVLSHGKEAKIITDRAVDVMSGVQNLRAAIYDSKLKIDAAPSDTDSARAKKKELSRVGINYAYRYAMLIILTAYLLEEKERAAGKNGEEKTMPPFATWLEEKREIRGVLSRQTLD